LKDIFWVPFNYLWGREFLRAIIILLLALLVVFLTKQLVVKTAHRLSRKTANPYDDLLSKHRLYDVGAYVAGLLILHFGSAFLITLVPFWNKIVSLLWVIVGTIFILRLLDVLLDIYQRFPLSHKHPIKGYIQIVKIFIYVAAAIVGLCDLLGRSPWAFLSGLGALSAVLILIFRHTLLSFVASFQIVSQDLFNLGDWIEMPKYGADGEVIDIALHTIKVQNWDRTIVVIPTYKFLEESFKNWRGMELSGGRRIKRAILVDQSSIKLCDQALLERLRQVRLLKDYLEQKIREIEEDNLRRGIDPGESPLNSRRLTNLGTFRVYIENYLRAHPKIRKDMTLMVRQLPPTPQGLPLEVYCFVGDTRWVPYERVQADIFDHILSVAGEFELRVFQTPTGWDLKEGLKRLGGE